MIIHDRYEYNPKTDLLGSGGFGRVYKAKDTFLDIDVALKIVNADDFPEQYGLIKEVKKGIMLSHHNLVRYLDAFELKGNNSFGEDLNWQVAVMEYIPGGELSSMAFKTLSYEEQQNLVLQILDGISYLHKEGIIHRDIKPSNILLLKRNNELIPKICDFGISKQISGKSSDLSHAIGTPSYVPPEYFENDKRISFASDFWSLGVLLFELNVGVPPFGSELYGNSSGEVLKNIISCNVPEEINSISEPFQGIIRRCLVKDRDKRMKNCKELNGTSSVDASFKTQIIDNDLEDTVPSSKSQPNISKDLNERIAYKDSIKGTSKNKILDQSKKRTNSKYLILKLICVSISGVLISKLFDINNILVYNLGEKYGVYPMIFFSTLIIGIGHWFLLKKYVNYLFLLSVVIASSIPYYYLPEFIGTFYIPTIILGVIEFFSLKHRKGLLFKWLLFRVVPTVSFMLIHTYLVFPYLKNEVSVKGYFNVFDFLSYCNYDLFLGLFFTKVYLNRNN